MNRVYKIIYNNLSDGGEQKVPYKSQYVRGTSIFICPFCGAEIWSGSYNRYRAFEDACAMHLKEKHPEEVKE